MRRYVAGWLIAGGLFLASAGLAERPAAGEPASSVTIDYPLQGSIFPPEFPAPTFLWRDSNAQATEWQIEIAFGDDSRALRVKSAGERMKIGEIDPRCVSATNKPPELTPEQAAAHTWTPDEKTWAAIKQHSARGPARMTIAAVKSGKGSGASVEFTTSKDPVGAPIFYRDVPLMPSETKKGVIKPLARGGDPADRVALAQRGRDFEPVAADGHAHLRELPLVLGGRQDSGDRLGWSAERQGAVRAGGHQEGNVDRDRGHDHLEFSHRHSAGSGARGIHVAGLAGRDVRPDRG